MALNISFLAVMSLSLQARVVFDPGLWNNLAKKRPHGKSVPANIILQATFDCQLVGSSILN